MGVEIIIIIIIILLLLLLLLLFKSKNGMAEPQGMMTIFEYIQRLFEKK